MEKTKRILAILMAVLMVATAFPMNVFAVDANTPVSLSGSSFKQGETVKAEFYSAGSSTGEWIGLYASDATPGPNTSIAWAEPSALRSGANIANYEIWKNKGTVNKGEYFNFQADNGYYYLDPGDYKFIYFADNGYDNYKKDKVAYFTVTSEVYATPEEPEFDKPSLSVNKTTFCVGEDILVTAKGMAPAWIGIHLEGDIPDSGNSYYWYDVTGDSGQLATNCVSGGQYVLQNMVAGGGTDGNFDAAKGLPEGEYVLRYFGDELYENILFSKNITIKKHGEINQTSIDKASFEADGKINGACADCGATEVLEVITKATAELEKPAYEQTGSATNAKVIVKDGKGNTLAEGTDYTLVYANNSALTSVDSKATATVTLNNTYYAGSITLEYDIIAPHEHQFTGTHIVKASFDKDGRIETICNQCPVVSETVVIPAITSAKLEKTSYIHTGIAVTPAVTLTDAKGNVLKNTEYTVSYANNTDKGTATATVTLTKENYEGTKELSFDIGVMEVEKQVYEEGEPIRVKVSATTTDLDWVGIYLADDRVADDAYLPFFYAFPQGLGTEYIDISNFSDEVINSTSTRGNFYTYWSADTLFKAGEYKVVFCADNGYDIIHQANITVTPKKLPQNVTVSTDKATYGENDTVKVTVKNATANDSVAIYKDGSALASKKVKLSADGKASISAKYLEDGTYTVKALYENVEDYVMATASFTVSRSSSVSKFITTNKTSYCGAEDIKVTAVGTGEDWVGLFHVSDMYNPTAGGQAAYFWYYAHSQSNDGKYFYGVGDEIVLNSEENLGSRDGYEFGTLEPGAYKVVLLANGGYDVIDQVNITITGHSNEVIDKKDSTCKVQGYEKYKCTVCGYESEKELDFADHNWNEGTLVSNATCSKDTVMNFTCLDCGENANLSVTGTATGHNYELTETKEATCSVPGYKKYICSKPNCDAPEKKEEITVSHEYVEQMIVEPTCTDTGLKMNVCKWCSAAKDNGTEVPATGHTLVLDKAASTAADCQKAGVNVYKCSNCAYSETKAGEAQKQHSYKEVITPATTTADGKIENKCEFCGTVSTSTVIAKASDITLDETEFVYEGAAITPIVIVRDSNGKSLKVRDDFTVEYKNNNAVGKGSVVIKLTGVKYTGEKVLEFTIKAASGSSTPSTPSDPGHKHTEVVVKGKAATCTTTGLTDGKKCTVCGEFTVAQKVIAATGHKEVALPAKDATYKATGLTAGKKCSVCGTVTVAQKTVARKKLKKVTSVKTKAVTLSSGTKSTLTLSWKKVTGAEKYVVQQYVNKKWKTIKTTSKTSYKVTKLKSNKSYKFRVRAKAGKYYGSYSKTYTAKTVPLKPTVTLKAGKKQLTASWKQVANITGYEVEYSTSKKFTKKTTKKVTIKKAKTKKTTIKKLTKGKKYYVRVRTYKTVGSKKVYSSWSTVKNVKVK